MQFRQFESAVFDALGVFCFGGVLYGFFIWAFALLMGHLVLVVLKPKIRFTACFSSENLWLAVGFILYIYVF